MNGLPPAARLPLLALALISMAGGTLAGLARLGWEVPAFAASQAGGHGALMVCALFGTVISLERAVALGRTWAYLAPAAAGLGGLALLAGAPLLPVQVLESLGALVLLAGSVQVLRRLTAPFTLVLALASACWLVGDVLWWADGAVLPAVPWWLAFLILTIAGERLELTRVLPLPASARRLFAGIVAVLVAGAIASIWREEAGLRLFSLGALALSAWLLRYDIARRTVRQDGLTRFIAVCLLSGYAWLALAGLLGSAGALLPGHPWRDAALHAMGLGFVFSMVFGHAPIILPAVTKLRVSYHPVLYLPLLVLHGTLALRVAGGLGGAFDLRRDGGLANVAALALFLGIMVVRVMRGKKAGRNL